MMSKDAVWSHKAPGMLRALLAPFSGNVGVFLFFHFRNFSNEGGSKKRGPNHLIMISPNRSQLLYVSRAHLCSE